MSINHPITSLKKSPQHKKGDAREAAETGDALLLTKTSKKSDRLHNYMS